MSLERITILDLTHGEQDTGGVARRCARSMPRSTCRHVGHDGSHGDPHQLVSGPRHPCLLNRSIDTNCRVDR